MRRRAYVGGGAAAAALAVSLVACTGGSDGSEDSSDSKPGQSSGSAAPAKPGTHKNLPEPCGSADESTLRELLLSGSDSDSSSTPGALEGEAAVTYDIDRRVGCSWKNATGLGSIHLNLDFERVVSYDSAVSDDDRASDLYDAKAREDEIPATPPATDTPSGDASGDDGDDTQSSEDAGDDADEDAEEEGDTDGDDTEGSEAPGESDDPESNPSPSTDPELAPRPLENIGDAAYLNDELTTADSGVHRDITLVFRAGNVIVTVEYDQWSTDKSRLPDSAQLQEKAQKLAAELAGRLDS